MDDKIEALATRVVAVFVLQNTPVSYADNGGGGGGGPTSLSVTTSAQRQKVLCWCQSNGWTNSKLALKMLNVLH